MSCEPDGKLKNTPFVQKETKPFKTIQLTLVLLGASVKEQFHGSALIATQFTTVSTVPLLTLEIAHLTRELCEKAMFLLNIFPNVLSWPKATDQLPSEPGIRKQLTGDSNRLEPAFISHWLQCPAPYLH